MDRYNFLVLNECIKNFVVKSKSFFLTTEAAGAEGQKIQKRGGGIVILLGQMDAFWIIKSSFSLFSTQMARIQQDNYPIFMDFCHLMDKKCQKKCLNLKMRTKTD